MLSKLRNRKSKQSEAPFAEMHFSRRKIIVTSILAVVSYLAFAFSVIYNVLASQPTDFWILSPTLFGALAIACYTTRYVDAIRRMYHHYGDDIDGIEHGFVNIEQIRKRLHWWYRLVVCFAAVTIISTMLSMVAFGMPGADSVVVVLLMIGTYTPYLIMVGCVWLIFTLHNNIEFVINIDHLNDERETIHQDDEDFHDTADEGLLTSQRFNTDEWPIYPAKTRTTHYQ
jgi:hypothetical protein